MRILYKHHITDIFVWVEDPLPKELSYGAKIARVKQIGSRPACLSVTETNYLRNLLSYQIMLGV